jgi:prepilin-type N-terminal cleavage/methylation domain-containing protein
LRPLPRGEGQRAKAFTLAEVLITLAVIGIVAALTMPALIANYQKKVTAIRVKHFYSMFSQAIRLSEAENGEYKNWDFPTSTNGVNITDADGTSRNYCNKSNRYMCTALIMLDGWEIKDDYPW